MIPDAGNTALRWPPLAQTKPRQIVVLCHGVGGDAGQLATHVARWAEAAPDAAFVAPCAPQRRRPRWGDRLCGRRATGHEWFAIENMSPVTQEAGVRRAAAWLDRFIDDELTARGLDDAPYALIGFSQGAMTVLFAGLRRIRPPACIICFAGALLAPDTLAAELLDHPRVVLVHGEQDNIVPISESVAAATALARQAVPVSLERRPGLGHRIDEAATEIGAKYLAEAFA